MTPKPKKSKVKLHYWIFIALIAGIIVGWLANLSIQSENTNIQLISAKTLNIFGFIGELFITALKMIIVPLIFSSIVVGLNSLDKGSHFGRMGLKTLAYYMTTSIISITIGLSLANLIKPGLSDGKPNKKLVELMQAKESEFKQKGEQSQQLAIEDQNTKNPLGFLGVLLKRMIPSNPLKAASDNGAMLSLIFMSILVAFAIIKSPPKVADSMQTFLDFFKGLNLVMLQITNWILATAPICIFALMAKTIGFTGFGILGDLGHYFFTVLAALSIHIFVVLPLLLMLLAKIKNPGKVFKAMDEALLMAFSTASSSATLPVTMRCIQEEVGVSKRTASFVLPLGATLNMDGTALYECIAVLFIAQVLGYNLGLAQQLTIVVLALLTSIGVAGVPSASLVAIVIIVNNVGIANATSAIGAIFAVDRLLDMSRTAVNVFSDSCGAIIIAKSEGERNLLS